jgi:hypothetical protein
LSLITELNQADLRNCATTLTGAFEFGIAELTISKNTFEASKAVIEKMQK